MTDSFGLSPSKRTLLEDYLRGRRSPRGKQSTGITRRPATDPAPLSPAQAQIWRREQMLAGGALPHNECITIRPSEYHDTALWERAFTEVVRRHEIWRTTYDMDGTEVVQVIHEPTSAFPLHVLDLCAASSKTREERLQELYTLGVRKPFDLRGGPLLHVTLVILSNAEQYLVIFGHLSILDGVSVYQILPFELATLCNAFASGDTLPFNEPPIQYADYAYWHKQFLMSSDANEQLNFWREELARSPAPPRWPRQGSGYTCESYRGAVRSFTLRESLRSALPRFSRGVGVTLFTTLAASLGALVYAYTGQPMIVLGTPSSGARKRPELQGLLGNFLNPVVLCIDFRGDPSFRELLRRTQEAVGTAVAHDEVPLAMPSRALPETDRPEQEEALFTTGISLQPKSAASAKGWHVTSMDADSGGTIWDLYLAFIETHDGLIGRAQYSTEQFEESRISIVLTDFQEVMEIFMSDLECPVATLRRSLHRVTKKT
jgi:hypothetical protein